MNYFNSIRYFDMDGNEITLDEFMRRGKEDGEWYRVAGTKIGDERVSTVLLNGFPCPTFETLVFPVSSNQNRCVRTPNKEAALQAHWDMCVEVAAAQAPKEPGPLARLIEAEKRLKAEKLTRWKNEQLQTLEAKIASLSSNPDALMKLFESRSLNELYDKVTRAVVPAPLPEPDNFE